MKKLFKWMASGIRVAVCLLENGGRVKLEHGKPLYLAKGARVKVSRGGVCILGGGVYLSRGSLLQVDEGASLCIGEGVFMNENVRIIAHKNVNIGSETLFGPNVCVYDHDHIFDHGGVRPELRSSPVSIGERCWIAANAIVTRGVKIADAVLVGAGSVASRSLDKPGVYVGAPAELLPKSKGV